MKKKILIIDDDWVLLEALKDIVETIGHEVSIARDGHEATKLFNEQRYHLIFMDLLMPVKNGWSTLERFRSINPLIPIIVMTGLPGQKKAAIDSGAVDILEKPFHPTHVVEILKAHLSNQPSDAQKIPSGEDR